MTPSYRWIVRIYPRSWRERYAIEYLLFLNEFSPSGRHLCDLLYAALEERFCSLVNVRKSPLYPPFSLLYAVTSLGLLLLAGCLLSGLASFHDQLARSTTVKTGTLAFLLLLFLVFFLHLPRTVSAHGLLPVLSCGFVLGLVQAIFVALTNLVAFDAKIGELLLYSNLSIGGIFLTAVSGLVAWKTGHWRAGIAAAAWSGLLAALLTLISLWILTYTFMDVMDHVNIIEGIRGVTNWVEYNINDNLGGTFFTLLLLPGAGVLLGIFGALIGKIFSPFQQSLFLRQR